MKGKSNLFLIAVVAIGLLAVFVFASGLITGQEKARQDAALFNATFDEQVRNEIFRQNLINFALTFVVCFIVIYGGIVLAKKIQRTKIEPIPFQNGPMRGWVDPRTGRMTIKPGITSPILITVDEQGNAQFINGLPSEVAIASAQADAHVLSALAYQQQLREQFWAGKVTDLFQAASQSRSPVVSARIINPMPQKTTGV